MNSARHISAEDFAELTADGTIPPPDVLWRTACTKASKHDNEHDFLDDVLEDFQSVPDNLFEDWDAVERWTDFFRETLEKIVRSRATEIRKPKLRARGTTNKADDFAHRGPWLQDMSLYMYTAYVHRRPFANLNSKNTFAFDAHYALARSYVQRINTRPSIPIVIGMKCSTISADIEGNAQYKALLCTPWRCAGKGACQNFDQFAHMCAAKTCIPHTMPTSHTFALGWKHRRSSIEVQAARAELKRHAGKRELVISDTTPLRQFMPAQDDTTWNSSSALRTSIQEGFDAQEFPVSVQQIVQSFLCATHSACQVWGSDGHARCPEPAGGCRSMIVRYHPEQLSMEEFVGHKLREVVFHIDLAAEAAIKPPKDNKDASRIIDEGDDDLEHGTSATKTEFCDIGGGGDDVDFVDDCDVGIRDFVPAHPLENLREAMKIAFREQALKNASLKKRKSKVEKELLACAEVYAPWMEQRGGTWIQQDLFDNQSSEDTSQASRYEAFRMSQQGLCFTSENARANLTHQSVILQTLKKNTEVHQLHEDHPPEDASMVWSDDAADRHCEWVPVSLLMEGPGAVAWHLLGKAACTEEQKDAVALLAWSMQKKFLRRPDMASHLISLKDKDDMHRAIWLGGGGVGKTHTLKHVVCPLILTFFGPNAYLVECLSNAAARHHGKYGRTIHSANGMLAFDSLRTPDLHLNAAARNKMDHLVVPLAALGLDEVGQIPSELLHANTLRFAYARAREYDLDTTQYRFLSKLFGMMQAIVLCGDFLQFQPVPPEGSVISPLVKKSTEHKDGAAIFASIQHVVSFEEMQRFTDPVLRDFLAGMRVPGGRPVSAAARQAIKNCNLLSRQTAHSGAHQPADGSPAQTPSDAVLNSVMFREAAYEWQIVTFASQVRTKAQAAAEKRVLYYIQAVDRPSYPLQKKDYMDMLEEPNMQKTKKLPGLLGLFVGQQVVLTQAWLPPLYVPGAKGKVVGIQPHGSEAPIFDAATNAPQRASILSDGCVLLRFQPPAVYVHFENSTDEFLLPTPCPRHADGADRQCCDCKFHTGVIAVEPKTQSWQWRGDNSKGHQAGDSGKREVVSVRRTQAPLMPLCASTLHQLQGETADPGLVAHMTYPSNLSKLGIWLSHYVTFSRPRSFDNLRLHGEPDWGVLEGGPPKELMECLDHLFSDKIEKTRIAMREAREALGWPRRPNP